MKVGHGAFAWQSISFLQLFDVSGGHRSIVSAVASKPRVQAKGGWLFVVLPHPELRMDFGTSPHGVTFALFYVGELQ